MAGPPSPVQDLSCLTTRGSDASYRGPGVPVGATCRRQQHRELAVPRPRAGHGAAARGTAVASSEWPSPEEALSQPIRKGHSRKAGRCAKGSGACVGVFRAGEEVNCSKDVDVGPTSPWKRRRSPPAREPGERAAAGLRRWRSRTTSETGLWRGGAGGLCCAGRSRLCRTTL